MSTKRTVKKVNKAKVAYLKHTSRNTYEEEGVDEDLEAIAERLNSIIDRSKSIDDRLTDIEIMKSKKPLNPIKLTPISHVPMPKKGSEPSSLNTKPARKSPPKQASYSSPVQTSSSRKSNFQNEYLSPNQSASASPRMHEPTLRDILEAINSLRKEVEQIAKTQQEMKADIAKLRSEI